MKLHHITLFILIFFNFTLLSQPIGDDREFTRGYKAGFKKGYCLEDPLCFPPVLTGLLPQPSIGYNSFSDGYARGVTDGKAKKSSSQSASQGGSYRNPSGNSNPGGSYRNPKQYVPPTKSYNTHQMSPEGYAALGMALGQTLTGFGLYAGFNSGFNFGSDIYFGRKASIGMHFGNTMEPDRLYGINKREDLGINLGLYVSKKKNLIFKSTLGYFDLKKDFDAFPEFTGTALGANGYFSSEYRDYQDARGDWFLEGSVKFYYKFGLQWALNKYKLGSGFSPEIYISNFGIGFGVGYIFNLNNPNVLY